VDASWAERAAGAGRDCIKVRRAERSRRGEVAVAGLGFPGVSDLELSDSRTSSQADGDLDVFHGSCGLGAVVVKARAQRVHIAFDFWEIWRREFMVGMCKLDRRRNSIR
jgi:hypothetical protein